MKIRKTSPVLEAIQFDGSQASGDQIVRLTQDSDTPAKWKEITKDFTVVPTGTDWNIHKNKILTLHMVKSTQNLEVGDWCIEGNGKTFYRLADSLFKENFETVEENKNKPFKKLHR